ncbi:IMP cyclohydrolase; phosphoribosylaminoimidazolecarboxamide formyltransferase [Syntrophobotulus glycolicus DSM 8271]|uniref:Bifunctional purine biosynthesis protein PurH n=1 Tax=Syntrophobotulus glycolicus (strain DSM 8271 / FlGlyR) TaxID=645991 RepID=F0SUS5_SYNGF|nr:bifunctional phosphoribosylaminoimidazolecarboxamide formyltransferase/IMP cyclohydrolase [Syntrophobotulus glycolicus]ADY56641.1 IMP cyclohydrolase; phosphoribosylaminoimidazolecarboxamide formyltransferase [Syntrophobotulus glycolicus DSM 8271]
MNKRALISVSDKAGIVEFAGSLAELGFQIISTGGTYKTLEQAGLPVIYVSEITGFPEILDGRVKTLHPVIHGGILAMDSEEHKAQCKEHGIELIDLVCVNLYPFRETIAKEGVSFEDAIENIDIGGPTMVRSAAKNHERVTIVVNPENYREVIEQLKKHGHVPLSLRKRLAAEAFAHTAEYDRLIAGYLEGQIDQEAYFPRNLRIFATKVQDLRYGENPGQKAAFYADPEAGKGTLAYGRQLQGKELSYNNWMDMDAAWCLVQEYRENVCAIIKHTNPCGLAIADSVVEAYEKALACDPVSAFGGIIAFNRVVDDKTAEAISKRFYEVIIAPDFTPEAQKILAAKVNLRLFAVGREEAAFIRGCKIRTVNGGFLLQDEDIATVESHDWQVVSNARPTEDDLAELEFAWKVCKHVKSNAIVVTNNRKILGVGAGQMNRVGSAGIALEQAGERAKDAYLASDAYFPFSDSVDVAYEYGIKAIVQPGGSIRDKEVIDRANELGMILLFTGRRHFRH